MNTQAAKKTAPNWKHAPRRAIEDTVFNIIGAHMKWSPNFLKTNPPIDATTGADSLDSVEIIVKLENTFGIVIPNAFDEKVRTSIQSCVNVVERFVRQKKD